MTAAVAQAGSEETILRWSPYVGFTFGALTFLNHLAPAISEPGGEPGTMASRRAVILTPSRSSHPIRLLSRQQNAPISPLAATLMDLFAGVANKGFTRSLSLLAATGSKNHCTCAWLG